MRARVRACGARTKGGRWRLSRTLNKAVNVSHAVKTGDVQKEGVKEVFSVVEAKANTCRRRRGEQRERRMMPTGRLMSLSG